MASINSVAKNIQTWPGVDNNLLRLFPGDTEVTKEQLKILRAHPIFQEYVKRKLLIVQLTDEEQEAEVLERIESRKKTKQKEDIDQPLEDKVEENALEESLEGLSQREIVKRIFEMTDKEQLELLSKDGRTKIAEAAKQQLASL